VPLRKNDPRQAARFYLGDCLEVVGSLPESSVDLVVADPPYHRVKGEAWDRQWKTDADYLAWVGRLCEGWRQVLRPNGSLYVFASPRMAARVECKVGEYFEVLNRITWRKPVFGTKAEMNLKESQRSYFPVSEAIVFVEHFGADSHAKGESGYGSECDRLRGFIFEPLRAYLDGERKRAGIDKADCNAACGFSRSAGGMASRHYFSPSQWHLPTQEHYAALQRLFNGMVGGSGDYLRREYEDLRREYKDLWREYEDLRRGYEDLRRQYEDLRRPFTVSADVPYTDVWDFPTVQHYPGKHPCEKPAALLQHIMTASSRPNAVVLDPFMGGGSLGAVCRDVGRRYIGIEMDPHWYAVATHRVAQVIVNGTTARE
jgi:adenine-specific DNA-methyltransferase